MGLIANVFRQVDQQLADGSATMQDCTNGGWSSRYNQVCIVNANGPFEPNGHRPAVMLVRHPAPTIVHVFAVLRHHHENNEWTQMGGNFLYTSDSRFGELVCDLLGDKNAFVGAVPIHDRIEG